MPPLIASLRAVSFDLDGTLIDSAPDLAAAANAMLAALSMRTLPERRIAALIGDGIDALVLRLLTESVDSPPAHAAQHSEARALFGRLYGQRLYERSRVYPGVPEGLHALSGAGLNLVCVTNKAAEFALPLLKAARLHQWFSFTLCPGDDTDRKPSPKLLLAACACLGIRPAELLHVGDSCADVDAARAAGCSAVAVSYGYDHRGLLDDSKPDAVVGSLVDLFELPLPRKSA